MKKYWMSAAPVNCDWCGSKIGKTFVDGKTTTGQWGCLCPSCHKKMGGRLGTGLGQQYEKQADGKWLKTKG